ncbi:carbonic anhydrase [Candidatus Berkiella aquae]|uniref:carbonic anhydrase n=1 Tax=Candidatus Berkiella aquae TaxID=295108 RepID=A0A0Q9YK42_9GAMM|nr:carbonic anhydrase [Candidatus Berkiella aquae]MCS5710007.1 carbonic anhydrase [Candidatus Berkiella aquae]
MTNKAFGLLISSLLFFSPVILANESAQFSEHVREFVKNMVLDNNKHVTNIAHDDFKLLSEGQNPRATVVSCSDSRVQTKAFNQSPVNDLFFIRNIGNQIKSAEGSVEYGINHLHTPILLIIGHSHCGAIQAALSDYSKESPAIRQELDNLHLPKATELNHGVVENVNQQVEYALNKFKHKIDAKELMVIGALYDFRDDYHQGHGRLIIINLNGEEDAKKIKADSIMKGLAVHTLE